MFTLKRGLQTTPLPLRKAQVCLVLSPALRGAQRLRHLLGEASVVLNPSIQFLVWW